MPSVSVPGGLIPQIGLELLPLHVGNDVAAIGQPPYLAASGVVTITRCTQVPATAPLHHARRDGFNDGHQIWLDHATGRRRRQLPVLAREHIGIGLLYAPQLVGTVLLRPKRLLIVTNPRRQAQLLLHLAIAARHRRPVAILATVTQQPAGQVILVQALHDHDDGRVRAVLAALQRVLEQVDHALADGV